MEDNNGIVLFKTANNTASFIVEYLKMKGENERTYEKVGVKIIELDAEKKAKRMVKFYLDIPAVKVVMHHLWKDSLSKIWTDIPKKEFSQFKNVRDEQRSFKIVKGNQNYRFSVMNNQGEKKNSMYFDLTFFQTEQVSTTVSDFLRAREFAQAVYDLKTNAQQEK